MHGLYPASKYLHGLTPQLLVRYVPVSFCRTSKLALHRILGVLHPCLHDRATCEGLFFRLTPCEIVFIYCQCIPPVFTFRNRKDENLNANLLACKTLRRIHLAFAQGMPQEQ